MKMSLDSAPPDPRDVTDFRFKKLCYVRVSDGNLDVPSSKPVNLLAVSNKYGLVFAATQKDIKVIRTVDIEKLVEDKLSNPSHANDYIARIVPLNERPWHLSLASDDLTLSVCVIRDSCAVVDLYDVRGFAAGKDVVVKPFVCIRLSVKPGVDIVDLKWNKAVANVFAVCLSDGSVSVYESFSEYAGSLKICGNIPSVPVASTAICWSPKGKLVVGRKDGSIIMYLSNLQEAKRIPAPTIFENGVSVLSITWLPCFQFAAAYMVDGRPSLVLVTHKHENQKTAPCSYVNFDDVCFATSESQSSQYYMIHLAEWNLLMCSSSNAIEVALLAKLADSSIKWEQWILEDSGRAELPLMDNDETHPVGMTIDFTSKRHLPINDTDIISPKPIVHILSTAGVLCSFYAISHRDDHPSVQKPMMVLSPVGARGLKSTSDTNQPTSAPPKPQEVTPQKLPAFSDLPVQPPPSSATSPGQQQQQQQPRFGSIVSGKPPSIGFGSIMSGTPVTGTSLKSEMWKTPAVTSSSAPLQTFSATPKANVSAPAIVTTAPASTFTTPTSSKASLSNVTAPASPLKAVSPHSRNVLVAAIKEEMLRFGAEISAQRKASVGDLEMNEAELKSVAAGIREMSDFVDEAKKATKGLNLDVHALRGHFLETYGSIEEIISMERRTKDERFLKLLRTRGLDPLSVKKMRDIRTLAHYLEQQIRDVHDVLDRQWAEREQQTAIGRGAVTRSMRSRGDSKDLPKVEMIYRTVLANLNAMHFLEQQIDDMVARLDALGRRSLKPGLQHDSIWSVSKCDGNTFPAIGSLSPPEKTSVEGRMPSGNYTSLRRFLEKRQVTRIRPPSPSENEISRLISPRCQRWNEVDDFPVVNGVQGKLAVAIPIVKLSPKAISAPEPVTQVPSVLSFVPATVTSPSSKGDGHQSVESNFSGFKLASTTMTPLTSISKLNVTTSSKIKPLPATTASSVPSFSFTATSHGFSFSSKFTSPSTFDSSAFKPASSFGRGSIFGTVATASNSPTTTKTAFSLTGLDKPVGETSTVPLEKVKIAPLEEIHECLVEEPPSEEDEAEEDAEENDNEEGEDDLEEEEEEELGGEEYADGDETEEYEEDNEDAELLVGQDGKEVVPISLASSLRTESTLATTATVPHMTSSISPSDGALKPAPVMASPMVATGAKSSPSDSPATAQPTFGTQPMPFAQSAGSGFTALFGTSTAQSTTTTASSSVVTASTFKFVSSSEPAVSTTTSSTTSASLAKLAAFSFKPATASETPATTTAAAVTTSTAPIFGQAQLSPTTATAISSFGSPPANAGSLFRNPTPVATGTSASPFGAKFSFTQAASTPQSGTVPSIFGGKPAFGVQPVAAAGPTFGQSGSSAFSPSQTPAFGAQAKIGFGQKTTPVFGEAPQLGQPLATGSFGGGGGGSIFGQASASTGFFSGLGGKPDPANANRNIFGGSASFGASSESTNLFGGGTASSLWSKPAGGGGSFQSGMMVGGVGQTGFGGFQQSPPRTGGFGGSPSFGAAQAPTFGSSPAFGGAPTFGGLSPVGGRVFGSAASPTGVQESPGFGSIAVSSGDAPSFGALATAATSGFGSPVGQPGSVGVNENVVGSPPPIFRTQNPSFGAPGTNVFGSSGSSATTQGAFGTQGSSPSFSQWRS